MFLYGPNFVRGWRMSTPGVSCPVIGHGCLELFTSLEVSVLLLCPGGLALLQAVKVLLDIHVSPPNAVLPVQCKVRWSRNDMQAPF
jgi:hypothetical protein